MGSNWNFQFDLHEGIPLGAVDHLIKMVTRAIELTPSEYLVNSRIAHSCFLLLLYYNLNRYQNDNSQILIYNCNIFTLKSINENSS